MMKLRLSMRKKITWRLIKTKAQWEVWGEAEATPGPTKGTYVHQKNFVHNFIFVYSLRSHNWRRARKRSELGKIQLILRDKPANQLLRKLEKRRAFLPTKKEPKLRKRQTLLPK